MSLFTLRDVWSFPLPEPGTGSFSFKSLAIANIDNSPEGGEKLIVGSEEGVLRILGPPTDTNSEGSGNLLAEFHLGSPILQVSTGAFLGGSPDLQLGILHPHRLGIYGFSKLGGQVEYGSQYKVSLLYEHPLKRHAFNMVVGPFGQSQPSGKGGGGPETTSVRSGRDFICVQSLDGTLSFFEQEVFTFSRYLPNFLLPGPLAFLPSNNSFLTVTSSWELHSFRYGTLAGAKDEPQTEAQTEESSRGKRLRPDWTCSLGEEPTGDIQVLVTKGGLARIVVLTFRLLLCFSSDGELLWAKRLDFTLCSSFAFLNPLGDVMTLIASAGSDTLYLFNRTTLKWAAKIPFSSVALSRIQIKEVDGFLVLLGGEGQVGVFVLGTEPSLFIAPPIQSRELDYEEAEKELVTLRKVIAEAGEQSLSGSRENRVDMKVEFEGQKRIWVDGVDRIALIATVKILCRVRVNEVRVTISTSRPIICTRPSVYIGDIVGRHAYSVEFYAGNEATPSDLECEVSLFYLTEQETPHCVQKGGVRIPFFIIAKTLGEIVKEGEVKLTLGLNKPVLNLMTLYSDFDWDEELNKWGLSFLLQGGESVTLLASTKGNTELSSKYRLQAESLAAIHLLLRDFMERLQRKYGRDKDSFLLSLPSTDNEIPLLSEYFQEIDAHVLLRQRQIQIKEDVSGRAAQLRGIQRRLLIRFRDKNAFPMTHLETLLEGSLEQILDALNFMEQNQLEKEKSECRLNGASRLILELCLLQSGRSAEEVVPVRNALCPSLDGLSEECGWEEIVYSGLTFLKSQEPIRTLGFGQMDMSKLKKVIKARLEGIKKGKDTKVPSRPPPSAPSLPPQDLKGNEMVERMMSAKSRAEKRRTPILPSIPEPPIADGEGEGGKVLLETHSEEEMKDPKGAYKESPLSNNNGPTESQEVDDGFW